MNMHDPCIESIESNSIFSEICLWLLLLTFKNLGPIAANLLSNFLANSKNIFKSLYLNSISGLICKKYFVLTFSTAKFSAELTPLFSLTKILIFGYSFLICSFIKKLLELSMIIIGINFGSFLI